MRRSQIAAALFPRLAVLTFLLWGFVGVTGAIPRGAAALAMAGTVVFYMLVEYAAPLVIYGIAYRRMIARLEHGNTQAADPRTARQSWAPHEQQANDAAD